MLIEQYLVGSIWSFCCIWLMYIYSHDQALVFVQSREGEAGDRRQHAKTGGQPQMTPGGGGGGGNMDFYTYVNTSPYQSESLCVL